MLYKRQAILGTLAYQKIISKTLGSSVEAFEVAVMFFSRLAYSKKI